MEQKRIKNLEELTQWAEVFTKEYLSRYKKVLLYAPMGAGKTTFIKEVCKFLGVGVNTASPTFALIHQYPVMNTAMVVHHADLYRLENAEEAFNIGLEELFYDDNYLFVEWPELIEPFLPKKDVIFLKIQVNEQNERIFELKTS